MNQCLMFLSHARYHTHHSLWWTYCFLHKRELSVSKWEKMVELSVGEAWYVRRSRSTTALHNNSTAFSWLRVFSLSERASGFNVRFYSYAQEKMAVSIDQDNGETCTEERLWFNRSWLGLSYTIQWFIPKHSCIRVHRGTFRFHYLITMQQRLYHLCVQLRNKK